MDHREPLTPGLRHILLAAILAVGAWLRFQHLGAIEYNVDQAYPIWQAIRTLRDGALPLVGQGTSVLFANPPLTGYLYIPVMALFRAPIAAYVFTLILNTFAIWLAYRALERLLGPRAALVGAALFAVNPWIIEDSRRTWVQALAPFFVCLIFWALAPVLTRQTAHPGRRMLIALVAFALFAHSYLLAYALGAPVAVLLLIFRRRVPWRAVIAGGAVFAVLMALYGIGLARQWEDTQRRAEDFAGGSASLSAEALDHALRLVSGWNYAAVRGQNAPANDADLRDRLDDIPFVLWTAAVIAGAAMAIRALVRRDTSAPPGLPAPQDAAILLLVWFALPVLMMSNVSQRVHPFYLLLTVPAGHALAAWGVRPLLSQRGPALLVAAAVIGTGAIGGLNAVRFAQDSAAHPGEDVPTLPLAEASDMGDRLRDAWKPGVAVYGDVDPWTPGTLIGEPVRVERLMQHDRAMLIPPAGGLYLGFRADGDVPPVVPIVGERAGDPLVLRDGVRIDLWRAVPEDVTPDHPADAPSDIGARLVGWSLDGDLAPGAHVTLTLVWHIDSVEPDRGVWAFGPYTHVTDATGAQVVNTGGAVIPGVMWKLKDLMLHRFAFDVPADAQGPLALDVGLYDSVRGVNAIFETPGPDGSAQFGADVRLDGSD